MSSVKVAVTESENLQPQAISNSTATEIYLQFNIDGLPIYKSSKIQLWLILAMCKSNEMRCTPIICALFLDTIKPPVKYLLLR